MIATIVIIILVVAYLILYGLLGPTDYNDDDENTL